MWRNVLSVSLLLFVTSTYALRCWDCKNAKSDEDCKKYGSLKQCYFNEDACMTETRRGSSWGRYPLISKGCKASDACKNNQNQNYAVGRFSLAFRQRYLQCNTKAPYSVCTCCCGSDGCNEITTEDCGGVKVAEKPKAPYWGYTGKSGPTYWYENWAVCNSWKQSPINIDTSLVLKDTNLPGFDASSFTKKPDGLELTNNGHSLVLNIDNGHTIIGSPGSGSALPGTYKVVQLHLHWGEDLQTGGSEHTVDGNYYWAELHIVHMNTKYESLVDALSYPDGLAVLGFFIEIGSEASPAIEKLLEPVRNGDVNFKGDKYEYPDAGTIVQDLFPQDLSSYYRYMGSLTTPPCSEAVVWTVFKSTISISEEQANVFLTQLYEKEEGYASNRLIQGNFRIPYPLNGRVVRES